MEPPISLEADAIRDEKVKVLKSIRLPANPQEVDFLTVRGQYGTGEIDSQVVVATATSRTSLPTRLHPPMSRPDSISIPGAGRPAFFPS